MVSPTSHMGRPSVGQTTTVRPPCILAPAPESVVASGFVRGRQLPRQTVGPGRHRGGGYEHGEHDALRACPDPPAPPSGVRAPARSARCDAGATFRPHFGDKEDPCR